MYWMGIITYLIALCFSLGAFLWKSIIVPPLQDPDSIAYYMLARTCSTMEALETVFSEIQDSYTGLGGVSKVLYSLSAFCYLSVLVIYVKSLVQR